jgi:hypothetical protein
VEPSSPLGIRHRGHLAARPIRERQHRSLDGRLGESVYLRQTAVAPSRGAGGRHNQRRPQPALGEPSDVQPHVPHGSLAQHRQPNRPGDFIQVHPSIDFRYNKVTLEADWAFVGRESVEDGIYGPIAGLLPRTGQLSRQRYVGSSPEVTWTWNATRHLTILAGYIQFLRWPFPQGDASR